MRPSLREPVWSQTAATQTVATGRAGIGTLPHLPPFGSSRGSARTTKELLGGFVRGDRTGHSPDAQVEGAVLLSGDEPLAIRLDGAVLVRGQVGAEATALRAALCGELTAAGMVPVEEDTPLALVVEAELFARRGYPWDLWAHDPESGRAALAARAAGDMPGILEAHDRQSRENARIEAVLRELERDL